MIPIPDKISFQFWVGMFKLSVPNLNVPIPLKENEWRIWASIFIQNNNLDQAIPSKKSFPLDSDWRKWVRISLQTYNF